ncbi:hypothetical protein TSUD_15780 [Trifolium subterraneum]|uniref:RNA-dependent RNA polymerase n=1 Tax=Trifolium subterraneum TaxID=3900 RepID=A0A2Z6NLA7_TRISU|nr:hypothetical protein TSUD_15780 [Trifolium subterraneum]
MKIRVGKGRIPRAFAIIQFTTARHATFMIALPIRSASTLRYGSSYLKVREMERDIDPNPRSDKFISWFHGAGDKEPLKATAEPCIELGKLFSTAVDFPKTGIPAVTPRELFAKEYPNFMEKSDKATDKSNNVIGTLFREIQGISTRDGSITSFTREVAKSSYDTDMEMDGFMDYVDDAFYHKSNYDYKLGNLMDYYGIKTESEILSGNIMKMSKSFTKRRDADVITMAVRSLRKEARSWFNEGGTGVDSGSDDAYAKASPWYYVTYHHNYYGLYNEGYNQPRRPQDKTALFNRTDQSLHCNDRRKNTFLNGSTKPLEN